MKKLISTLLAVVMIASLAGCGGKQPEAGSSGASGSTGATEQVNEEKNGNKTEIRFAWWGDTKRHEVYDEICNRFEAANPDIKVIREPNSWSDYWDKLATQTAGGNAPDVFGMHPQFVADYARRDALAEIQSYVDSGIIDTSKMSESVIGSGRVGGKLYMISQGVTFTDQIVNTTLLEKFGGTVKALDADMTWADFMAEGEKVTAAAKAAGEDIYWCTDYSNVYNTFRYMARQAGGDLYTEDGQLDFTKETVEQWFAYWKEMRDKGLIPDGAASTEDMSASLEQKIFTQGAVCYTTAPANQLHLYQQQMPDAVLSCARNPIGNDGARGEYIEGAHFAIANTSTAEKKEAAAKLIDFFVNTEESMELFKMEQGVPANSEMVEYIKTLLDETMTIEIDFVNATMAVAGEGTYAPVGATEIDTAFKDAAAMVQFDEKTPAEAAEDFMKAAQAVIDKNQS
ncbi:extracellular solute-binding protein [Hungatella hathewayi]|uniref:ABC transporter substrate-binding protein n=1 Tax=Hungatella hathewayi TaxID=154046 RepID=UPI0003367052|nr:extracellular solute-binding protein [Hungatella hathewayi]CCZ58466.1 extracellular solute-binding protein family 1 [Hungatella hathewayi CAG:224]